MYDLIKVLAKIELLSGENAILPVLLINKLYNGIGTNNTVDQYNFVSRNNRVCDNACSITL